MTAVLPMPTSHQPRLHRLENLFCTTPLYFLTVCTHERKPLLADNAIHLAFQKFCERAAESGVFVGRYVLMPDHLHTFVSIAEAGATLSIWIKSLKNSLSKTLRENGHAAPHWQKGFFDHVMRSADSYSEKWEYVRANPVRAGLTPQPEVWPFQGKIHDLQF
jgi:putative transposase